MRNKAPNVQTSYQNRPTSGVVIDNAKVEELPLANRQFYQLAQIAPGVLPPAQASSLGFRECPRRFTKKQPE